MRTATASDCRSINEVGLRVEMNSLVMQPICIFGEQELLSME
jgi:hypothetical protein